MMVKFMQKVKKFISSCYKHNVENKERLLSNYNNNKLYDYSPECNYYPPPITYPPSNSEYDLSKSPQAVKHNKEVQNLIKQWETKINKKKIDLSATI